MPPPLLKTFCAITHASALSARADADPRELHYVLHAKGRLSAALISGRHRMAFAQQRSHIKAILPPQQLPHDLLRLIAQTALRQEGSSQQA